MDIRELRTFLQVARAGSFSRAAAELHIAQPALSRQIAKLEAEIGAQIFIRYGRGVRLTAAGARLLERAEMITQMVSETGELVRASEDEERGHLAIGLPPAIGQLVGVELIRAFKAQWPRVSLHVREGLSSSLQEWVLDRRVDLAVVYNQPLLDAFDVQPLFSEPLVLVGPPGDERVAPTLGIRDLAGIPLILPGLPHSNRLLIGQAALQHGVRLRVTLEVDSVALTKTLVRAGAGYSILAYAAIRNEIAAGELVAHRIERPAILSSVAIATLRERRAGRLVSAVAALLREKLHALVTGPAWASNVTWLDKGE
jgi:LysR family nitrogen assimilation transcriptional regulator